MEIHQRFGDHKTLMNDFSTPLRDLGAGLYDFSIKKYGNSTPTQTSENINE